MQAQLDFFVKTRNYVGGHWRPIQILGRNFYEAAKYFGQKNVLVKPLEVSGASATGLYEWIQTMKQSAIDNNQTGFISVTTFDNIKNKLFDNIDSKSLKFTINDAEREMSPRGTTRLYDTAIEDIDDLLDNVETFKKTLPKNIKKLNPNISITWVCCTDGMDNNSINTSEDLRERVIDARKKGVKCFFIAANQDAIMAGNNYGFTRDSSLTFSANRVNASMAFRSVSENMKRASMGSQNTPFTQTMRQSSLAEDTRQTIPTRPRRILRTPNLQLPPRISLRMPAM